MKLGQAKGIKQFSASTSEVVETEILTLERSPGGSAVPRWGPDGAMYTVLPPAMGSAQMTVYGGEINQGSGANPSKQ